MPPMPSFVHLRTVLLLLHGGTRIDSVCLFFLPLSIDEHAKRKRDEQDALDKQNEDSTLVSGI